jgi:hypothetical protein
MDVSRSEAQRAKTNAIARSVNRATTIAPTHTALASVAIVSTRNTNSQNLKQQSKKHKNRITKNEKNTQTKNSRKQLFHNALSKCRIFSCKNRREERRRD